MVFELDGRDLAGFGSRGQQRTAILAYKLAEMAVLTELDGRPPLLLLDDVFSELDPARRGHLVRRIAELPQAFVTTTALEDLDADLRRHATAWRVRAEADGARLDVVDGAGADEGVAASRGGEGRRGREGRRGSSGRRRGGGHSGCARRTRAEAPPG